MCSKAFISKKNVVALTDHGTVEKRFGSREAMVSELEVYRKLEKSNLRRPTVLGSSDGKVWFTCERGVLFTDLLNSATQELTAWRLLVRWLRDFYEETGLVQKDPNLRNFLYNAENNEVIGVDFEDCKEGRPLEMIGRLLAYIQLMDDWDPQRRECITNCVMRAACHDFLLCQDELSKSVRNEMKDISRQRNGKQFSAVILAGGKSRRMGVDKAFLELNGKTLIEHQKEKLQHLGITDILISGSAEGMIPDEKPGCGPLGGIATCLRKARHDRCLIIPVDVPLITEEILQELIDKHKETPFKITLVAHQGGFEQLIAVYDRDCAAAIERLLECGVNKVQIAAETVGYGVLNCRGNEDQFINCNTPEAFHKVLNVLPQEDYIGSQ